IILSDDPVAGTSVVVTDDELTIADVGVICRPQLLSRPAAADVVALIADAARPLTPDDVVPRPPVTPRVSAGGDYEDPAYDVIVPGLGDSRVVGGSKPLTAKQTALIAYLALHRGATIDTVGDALWVEPTASRHKRLANTVSETRAVLGAINFPVAVDS